MIFVRIYFAARTSGAVVKYGLLALTSEFLTLVDCPLWADQRPFAIADLPANGSDLGLLCHLQRVIDLDSEVANGALQLGMSE